MTIAYFSMEYGLNSRLPIYSGGLGILAGDILNSCVDLKVPVVGIGLLYKEGYFNQQIKEGSQVEIPIEWNYNDLVKKVDTIIIEFENKPLHIGIFQYDILSGQIVNKLPLYLLSTDVEENEEWQRKITNKLYQADHIWWRIAQEVVLGIGGVKALEHLGIKSTTYHLNEGHAAFSILEYWQMNPNLDKLALSSKFVFTIHTPVKAGHDRLPIEHVRKILSKELMDKLDKIDPYENDYVNMTELALKCCRTCNSVSIRHEFKTKKMFPEYKYKIVNVTNGVHYRWMSKRISQLLSIYSEDILNNKLRNITQALYKTHEVNKQEMIYKFNLDFNLKDIVITYARRATSYKRPDLILNDLDKLFSLGVSYPIQLIFAGKAHPQDKKGKVLIEKILSKFNELKRHGIQVAFIENYDMETSPYLLAGSDLWLNTPLVPFEASGTSGMKAAMNGVPQLSTYDGWWRESFKNTGWTFGNQEGRLTEDDLNYQEDSDDLYTVLEEVLSIYYNSKEKWKEYMINSALKNGVFFNTHRVVKDYKEKLWNM